jgi:hypothetical protein
MRSPQRCKCDECKSFETVLYEHDSMVPIRIATREMEIIRAIAE